MSLTNKLKPVVDLPIWEWMRFNGGGAVTDTTSWTTAEDGSDRYIYQMRANTMWKYDTVTDTWMQLSSANATPATFSSITYSKYAGNRVRVLQYIDSTTLKLPYVSGGSFLAGKGTRVYFGAGNNQENTILTVSNEVIEDYGVATTANTVQITDTLKKWKINQWAGYTCKIVFGTGAVQQRTILYNSIDTLYLSDTNYQAYEPFDNQVFLTAPSATAGAQSHFEIVSQIYTFQNPFAVPLDRTSKMVIFSGGVWALGGLAAAPRFSFQMYDVATDIWYSKTANDGIITTGAAVATDGSIERTGEIGGKFVFGTASAGTVRTITDATKNMTKDRYRNYQLRIVAGTGAGQKRRIVANGTNYFEVNSKFDITPDVTSQYEVYGDTNSIWFAGNGASAILKYHVEADLWTSGDFYDYGVANNSCIQQGFGLPFGITTATRQTTSVTAINPVPVAGGSGYSIGDVLTLSTGGSNGVVTVETISPTGAVLTASLRRVGSGYSVTTSATTGGTGTGCTIAITAVGTTGRITTTVAHPFAVGESITVKGLTEAAWNTTYTILTADTINTIEFVITATANGTSALSQSTTLIVDAAQTWDVNEHTGKLIAIYAAGTAGAATVRRIASNTATSITISGTITAATTGTTRYAIFDIAAIGKATQFALENQYGFGYASAGTATSLTDNTKNWIPGCWNNYRVRITAGTGLGNEFVITNNTETTLNFTAPGFTPDTTTRYEIMDTFGIATSGSTTTLVDTTKNWRVNQWAGKRLRFTGGTGQAVEQTIASNTATTLTFAAGTAPSTDTTYTILDLAPRSTGTELIWLFGAGQDNKLFVSRGGATNHFDFININNGTVELGPYTTPNFETFTTGTMYAYDGDRSIYINHNITNRIYRYDVITRELTLSGMIPYGHSTATLSNKMEIVNGPDGLKYLYVARHTGTEVFRTLLFW